MKWLVLLALGLSGCATPQWEKVMANRGHGAPDGQCAVFVATLQAKLDFKTRVVTFTVTIDEPVHCSVRHQVLMYTVEKEVWFIDNLISAPRWVGYIDTPMADMIAQFYAPARVRIENIRIDES